MAVSLILVQKIVVEWMGGNPTGQDQSLIACPVLLPLNFYYQVCNFDWVANRTDSIFKPSKVNFRSRSNQKNSAAL